MPKLHPDVYALLYKKIQEFSNEVANSSDLSDELPIFWADNTVRLMADAAGIVLVTIIDSEDYNRKENRIAE